MKIVVTTAAIGFGLYISIAALSLPTTFLPFGSIAAIIFEETGKMIIVTRLRRNRVAALTAVTWFAIIELVITKIIINYFVLEGSNGAMENAHWAYYTGAAFLPAIMHVVTGILYLLPFNKGLLLGAGTAGHLAFNEAVSSLERFSTQHAYSVATALCASLALASILWYNALNYGDELR